MTYVTTHCLSVLCQSLAQEATTANDNPLTKGEDEGEEQAEEEDDEDDESSDPDIEEEIQASKAQAGPGDDDNLHLHSTFLKLCFNTVWPGFWRQHG